MNSCGVYCVVRHSFYSVRQGWRLERFFRYRVLDAYDEALALGDLKSQTIQDVLGSASCEASLARDRQAFDKQCKSCKYLGACSGAYIHESRTADYTGNCPVAYPAIGFMQKYIEEQGFGAAELVALLDQIASTSKVTAWD